MPADRVLASTGLAREASDGLSGQDAYFIALYPWPAQNAAGAHPDVAPQPLQKLVELDRRAMSQFLNHLPGNSAFPAQTLAGQAIAAYTGDAYGYAVIEFFFLPCPLYTPNE
ncbi:hypothetical protein BTM36_12430 [Herbaspirillum sp. VT-16-41]|nr:hypothetical protein BTM36_12430 [Herbaspirillum sp. VT-16-41]